MIKHSNISDLGNNFFIIKEKGSLCCDPFSLVKHGCKSFLIFEFPKSKVKSRIIFTPQHAKRFMKALTENISRYEVANGAIKDLEDIQLPLNFGGPSAQA